MKLKLKSKLKNHLADAGTAAVGTKEAKMRGAKQLLIFLYIIYAVLLVAAIIALIAMYTIFVNEVNRLDLYAG